MNDGNRIDNENAGFFSFCSFQNIVRSFVKGIKYTYVMTSR